jgi:hypothetical protein
MNKICKKCNIEKGISDFYKDKNKKFGVSYYCKECSKAISKKYRENNIDEIKEYKNKNKSKFREYSKKYRDNNKELVYQRKIKSYDKKKEYYRNKRNLYKKERIKSDKIYCLYINISSLIRNSFKRNGFSKETRTYEILGCSFEKFKIYLESKFEPWMTWENKGLYNGEFNYGWDIDHIIPISTPESEEDVIKLNHYTNLQPLCSKINRDIKINII